MSAHPKGQDTTPVAEPGKLRYIDSLRGIAAVYVVFAHLPHVPVPNPTAPHGWNGLVNAGVTGVALFFIVSAFTLCLSMSQRRDEKSPVASFYLRRIFRIAPLFFVWLAVMMLFSKYVSHVWHSWKEWLLSFTFLFNFFPGKQQGIVLASWTLSVEMLFYAIFPFIFVWARSLPRAVSLLAASLGMAALFPWLLSFANLPPRAASDFLKMSFVHHLPVFVMGICAYLVVRTHLPAKPRWAGMLLVGLSAVGLVWGMSNGWHGTYWQWYFYSTVYAVGLLGLAQWAPRVLVNGVTAFYGKISYSVYLNHGMSLVFMAPVFSWCYALPVTPELKFLLSFLCAMAVITPLSIATYYLVEVPGMRVGKWVIERVRARSRAAASVPVPPPAMAGGE